MTLRARRRVLQPLRSMLEAARLHPERHGRVEPGRAGRIGVHVGGDPQALGARAFSTLAMAASSLSQLALPACLKW